MRSLMDFARWMLFGSGPVSSNGGKSFAFVRSDDPKLFAPDDYTIDDETSGPDPPDIEITMLPIGFKGMGAIVPYPSMNIGGVILRPQSRGVITLRSKNPFDPPVVDPKYLEKQNDVAVLVRGIKLICKVINTESMLSALEKQEDPLLDHDLLDNVSDEKLEAEVRKRAQTLCHPTSTCRMAKLEDEGVVDARLRVHGLENVRVVDASIFPRIISGHTTATVYAVAEKAADMIKEDCFPSVLSSVVS